MKILLTNAEMGYLSGSPLYFYTLAKELAKEHQVTLSAQWIWQNGRDDQGIKLRQGLEAVGVKCVAHGEANDQYDLGLLSHNIYNIDNCRRAIFIVHSEYDCETPIIDPRIGVYVCIRPSIKEHIVNCHGIRPERCYVIYNGVDRERFNKSKVKPKTDNIFRYVVPCTIDWLRNKFLNHMISLSSDSVEVNIYGIQCGGDMQSGNNVKFHKQIFEIEEAMAYADCVTGIHLGRVNLESMSMGIPSEIYDPITLEKQTFWMDDKEFDERHNIINVAKQLLAL